MYLGHMTEYYETLGTYTMSVILFLYIIVITLFCVSLNVVIDHGIYLYQMVIKKGVAHL